MPRLSGAELIARERLRQIEVEGYTSSHDDIHNVHQFIEAAAAYVGKGRWPWDSKRFKFATNEDGHYDERNLVKAGALIAAAIDRLQRAEDDIRNGVHF